MSIGRARTPASTPTRPPTSWSASSPAPTSSRSATESPANLTDVEVLTSAEFRERSRSFWLFGTGAGAALFAGALLGVIVGTVIVAQTLYSSTKDHLNEFATLRAIGSSRRYIHKVIVCQALLSAVIGFSLAALIGAVIVHMTASTALPIVITPGLTDRAVPADRRHVRRFGDRRHREGDAHRSGHGVHAMSEFVMEAVDVEQGAGRGAGAGARAQGRQPVARGRRADAADGAVRQRQDHAAVHPRLHADADRGDGARRRRFRPKARDPRSWPSSGAITSASSFNPITCFRR